MDQNQRAANAAFVVMGEGGWRGVAYRASSEERDGFVIERLLVRPEDGSAPVLVPAEMVMPQGDGTYYLPLTRSMALAYTAPEDVQVSPASTQAPTLASSVPASTLTGTTEQVVIPIVEETLRVSKRLVDTGRGVRVTKSVRETTEVVDEPLLRETVTVERVPVNRVITAAPSIRQEGDTIIVPVIEEVLVVEKRLFLREEVHITRQGQRVHEPKEVTLRHEEALVERVNAEINEPDTLERAETISRRG